MDIKELKELLANNKLDSELINYIYDSNLNMTYSELSKITGKTVKELKQILLEGF